MPLITKAVPNLIQGVSQQAEQQRLDGQASEQENAISSVVDGLTKRPQCQHIVELINSSISNNSFIHFIKRSNTEKYVLIYNDTTTKISAFNMDTGEEATIDGATGGKTIADSTYLATATPRESLRALTIGDSTFIVNREQVVAPDTSRISSALDKEAVCFIKQGDFEKKYGVTLHGDFTTAAASTAILTVTCECVKTGGRSSFSHYRVKSVAFKDVGSVLQKGADYILDDVRISPVTSSLFASTLTSAGISFASGRSSNTKINKQPTFNFTVNATTGALDNVSIVNAGSFGRNGQNFIGGDISFDISLNAPTGQAKYRTSNAADTISVEITSDVNAGTGSEDRVDSVNILSRMVSHASESTDFADRGITASSTSSSDDFSLAQHNNLVVLTRQGSNGGDFDITAHDGLAGNGMGVAYKKIDAITSLPLFNKNGFKIQIVGTETTDADDYYVEFKTSNNVAVGNGIYEECLSPETIQGIDVETMPFVFTNDAVNSFTTGTMNLADRKVGSEKSNPMPSFVGQNISDIFLYKNRLGFISEDDVVMSEANLGVVEDGILKFNFFRTTVQQLLDSDPIDVTVSSTKVTDLKAAVGYQENLILFSESGQFALKGGQLLTPTSISVAPITNFEFDQEVTPIPLGSYLYFPFNRGSFSGVQEFVVTSDTDNYDANEITEHVPNYIPSDLSVFKGSTSEDILLAFSPTEPNNLYVYKYFFSNRKKILTAWSKFVFGFEIRNFEMYSGVLFIVGTKESKTHLMKINLQSGAVDTGANYNTLLDMRRKVIMGASNVAPSSTNDFVRSTTSTTVVPLEYTASAGDTINVYDDEGNILSTTESMPLSGSASNVTLSSAHTGTVYVGLTYTMKYTFTKPFLKFPAGNAKAPSGFIKNKIRNGAIFFDGSAGFSVKVTPENRTATTHTYVNPFSNVVVGNSSINSINLQAGNFRFPVVTDVEGTVIALESDSALPSKFTSAEFEIFIHERARRYG